MEKVARDMDIELDSDNDNKSSRDDDDAYQSATQQRQLDAWKHQLDTLLRQPITRQHYSVKYPTQSSHPTEPFVLSELLFS